MDPAPDIMEICPMRVDHAASPSARAITFRYPARSARLREPLLRSHVLTPDACSFIQVGAQARRLSASVFAGLGPSRLSSLVTVLRHRKDRFAARGCLSLFSLANARPGISFHERSHQSSVQASKDWFGAGHRTVHASRWASGHEKGFSVTGWLRYGHIYEINVRGERGSATPSIDSGSTDADSPGSKGSDTTPGGRESSTSVARAHPAAGWVRRGGTEALSVPSLSTGVKVLDPRVMNNDWASFVIVLPQKDGLSVIVSGSRNVAPRLTGLVCIYQTSSTPGSSDLRLQYWPPHARKT
ncbi:hypothetical protein C8Q76DRAFT_698639 [Earliella scabrosa]|nr:hypothetical protein C8Q76DRAFT_698639 [Earliella scabrosa]